MIAELLLNATMTTRDYPDIYPATLQVVDGDTVRLNGVRIRLLDIDTPELQTARCPRERQLALAAKARLKQLLATGQVAYTLQDRDSYGHRDRYGRPFGVITVNGVDVAETMLSEGYALRWRPGRIAKTERLKVWCNG